MKKYLILAVLALCLTLPLSACGEGTPNENSQWKTIKNSQSKACISLDMTHEEAEKILTANPENETVIDEQNIGVFYAETKADRVQIQYQDDVVNNIQIGWKAEPEESNWSINGITLGNTREDVLGAFGEPTRVTGELLEYYYDAEGTLLTENTENAASWVVFSVENGSVTTYSLFDKSAVVIAEKQNN